MATVLLVEDEDQVRVLAQSYLEEQGHTVLTAATVDGALAVLRSPQSIDVLLTDMALKGQLRGGLELAIQAVELRPDIRVLYTTGRNLTDGMRAQFVPGSAFLQKPYTVEQLVTSLTVHFKIRPQSQETASKRDGHA